MKTNETVPALALDDLLSMAASAIEDLLEHTDPNTSYYSWVWADVPGRLRATMLQGADGTLINEGTMQAGNSPEIPDGSAVAALTGIPMIPGGYVLVPSEPTDEMIAAAMNCDDVEFNSDETFCVNFDNIYKAMIEAAQEVTSARVHPARDE